MVTMQKPEHTTEYIGIVKMWEEEIRISCEW